MTKDQKNLIKVLLLALIAALSACGTDPGYIKFTGVGCVKADGSVGRAYTDGSCR